jgi:hypothetical protein
VAQWLGWRKKLVTYLKDAVLCSGALVGNRSDISKVGVYYLDCSTKIEDREMHFVVSVSEPEEKVKDKDIVRKCPCGNIIMEVGLETCSRCRGIATKYESKVPRKIVTAVARDGTTDDDPSEEGTDSIAIESSERDDQDDDDDEP